MKYCQGPLCHTYDTQDRKRGPKGNKVNQTRRRSSFYYLQGNACSLQCQDDWFQEYGERALNHFGRVTEAKRTDCDNAWYKDYTWTIDGKTNHCFKNDLLGQRIAITETHYNDDNIKQPIDRYPIDTQEINLKN